MKLAVLSVVSFSFVLLYYFPIWKARAAATIIWDGGGDGTSWSDPSNWDTNVVPGVNDFVLIDSSVTVSIHESITVSSLVLGVAPGTASTTLNFAYDAISAGALTITAGNFTLYSGATVTHNAASGESIGGKVNIAVSSGNANIYGNINVNTKGYTAGLGPGGASYHATAGGGAAHAGYGGNASWGGGGRTDTYGVYSGPTFLGSGGASSTGSTGGTGGGAVKLTASGTITVTGNITANGSNGGSNATNGGSGGGSGGSIWLIADIITGSGNLTVSGGTGGSSSNILRRGGGGSGGRITIEYTIDNEITQSQYSAQGGNGFDANASKGGVGTIFIKKNTETGNLLLDNKTTFSGNDISKHAKTPLPSGLTVATLVITNYSHVIPIDTVSTNSMSITVGGTFYNASDTTTTYNTLNWTGGGIIDTGGTFAVISSGVSFTIPTGSRVEGNFPRTFSGLIVDGALTHSTNTSAETNKLNYTVEGDILISGTGSVNVNARGYTAQNGPGGGTSRAGATHAGYGGLGGSSNIYGSYTQPSNIGSGGGNATGSTGGTGGGAIKLTATGSLTINGNITANGSNGGSNATNQGAGGGSGGSIWLTAGSISGNANITANGGAAGTGGGTSHGGGGSGGRISINYSTSNGLTSTQYSAASGNGGAGVTQRGGVGTIFFKQSSAENGDLLLDNKATYGGNTPSTNALTPLPSNLVIDTLDIINYSHVIPTNTISVGTMNVSSYANFFSDVSTITTDSLNITSNGIFYNENTSTTTYNTLYWTGGRIIDNGGTFAVVSSGSDLTIPVGSTLEGNIARTFIGLTVNGLLTHTANSSSETYKINYTVNGNVLISNTGSINLNSKGYTALNGPGGGVSVGNAGAGGAAHTGYGGNGTSKAGSTVVYGSYADPINLGSGGGSSTDKTGGSGGGAVKLVATGSMTINGDITVEGGSTSGGTYGSGGGSGGSIWLVADSIAGSASITANGGASASGNDNTRRGGGGSGGRISVNYTTSNSLTPFQYSAKGGNGYNNISQKGGVGTVFIKKSGTAGYLLFDNKTIFSSNSVSLNALTPLPSVDVDTLTITNYSHIFSTNAVITKALNITSNSIFYKEDSTIVTETMEISGGSTFYNKENSSTTYNSLDWAGGSIIDNGGSFPVVSSEGDLTIPSDSTLEINNPRTFSSLTVHGVLTHAANTDSESNKIDITINGNVLISSSGQVNVNGKGYSAQNGPGAGGYSTDGAGGAAHGGVGGNGATVGLGSTEIYGSLNQPSNLGSGGGNTADGAGGTGGGAVKLVATGIMTINGNITANGNNGLGNNGGGGGSGGSIWLSANSMVGTANVTANGGIGRNGNTTSRRGGGGGGGRIALYYKNNDNLNLAFLTATGGSATANAQPGEDGTILLAGIPSNPVNLGQYKSDGETAIGVGGSTSESSIVAKFQGEDPNSTDTLTPQVEVRPLGTSFSNIASHTGTPVEYTGTIVTMSVSVTGLADGTSYHWQARVCDSTSLCSEWVSFGNNDESEADFQVVMNAPPNVPVIPSSSFYIDGQYTNNLQPTLAFVLSDPDISDAIGYNIQIDTNLDFESLIVNYTSAMGAQGTQEFTVGQAEGEGVYGVGGGNQELTTGNYYWRVRALDDKDAYSGWTLASGTPSFKIDLSKPTNATNVIMKAHTGATSEYMESEDEIWFRRNDLYFKWTAGTDSEGVKGYCLYLGLNPFGDPAVGKGLLGSSPVSTTGTTCEFIIDGIEIDFSNTAFRSFEWLTSSNEKYYFKVKTIDVANNIYEGPDVTNYISFNFDNTPPQNVTAISAPSATFSSTADMFFNWTTGSNGASDEHSQVLGFQYSINTKDIWWGNTMDEFTGINYSPMNREQPLYLPEETHSSIVLGQNTIYFRVADKAGNYSELRTAILNYGGEAPKFAQGDEITVTPTENTINRFAFSWPEATPSEGNTIETYYYMINTPPPASYSTITSNSATYIAIGENYLEESSLSGLRKGANTIYIAVVDQAGNYSPTNILSATFYLNSNLPDPPTNVSVADISIKDVSMWRAAVVWGEPEYKGTGTLTYHVYRSEDADSWEKIATTTGLTYVDNVDESKPYYWKVATVDNSDESIAEPSFSNGVTLIPRGKYLVPPDLTSGPAASSITTTKATISWTTNRKSDSKIAFGLGPEDYFESESYNSTETTEHRIILNNLNPSTIYYYVAKWTDEDGNTGISEESTFTTEPAPEVKDVRVSNRGVSSAIINFTTIKASSVKVYYGMTTSFGGVKTIGTSKLETTYALELGKLQDGTKYYYKINTLDEEGKEYEGTILDFETLPKPRVYNIKVQQVAKTAESTLYVTWNSNTAISSVVTFYPSSNPELMRDNVDLKLVDGEHEMLIRGLFPDTEYVLQVRGKDIIGNEAVSEFLRIRTSEDSRPPIISAMTIEGTNVNIADGGVYSQLIVSWNTDEPATSQVEYGEGSGESYNQLTQEDKNLSYNHVVIISGLTPSKVYHLRAISKDVAGNMSKSIDTVTITPKATDNALYLVITTLREAFGFIDNF